MERTELKGLLWRFGGCDGFVKAVLAASTALVAMIVVVVVSKLFSSILP